MKDNDGTYPFYGGLPPHQAHSATSKEAAIAAIPKATRDRQRTSDLYRARGNHGATSDEVQAELGLSHQTGSARVAELLQAGFIIESGRRRKTRNGRDAEVLVIAPPGTPPRNIRKRRLILKGFTEEEMTQLYFCYRDVCEQALANQKCSKKDAKLHALIVRLGFLLREHAGPAADNCDAKR